VGVPRRPFNGRSVRFRLAEIGKASEPYVAQRIAPKHAAILVTKLTDQLSSSQKLRFDGIAAQCPDSIRIRKMNLDFCEVLTSGDSLHLPHWIGRKAIRNRPDCSLCLGTHERSFCGLAPQLTQNGTAAKSKNRSIGSRLVTVSVRRGRIRPSPGARSSGCSPQLRVSSASELHKNGGRGKFQVVFGSAPLAGTLAERHPALEVKGATNGD
jgi:hypothetical protein